jgi:hypothetical protein
MAIKSSLVEHIFRGVWETNAAAEGDTDGERRFAFFARDDSDGDGESTADDADSATRTAAHVKKIHSDALKLSSEFLRLFVEEALQRAQVEAMIDDSATVEPHHIEQIVAQLLLDF